MALPSSPASISLSQVNTELGLSASATITMNNAAVRALFGISSGAISMSNGYGKSNGLAADYLVIGGGGGAGNVNPNYYNFDAGNLGGGGGAGGYLTGSPALSGSYTITIGAGAAGAYPSNGSNSSIIGGSLSITATGGGSGGTYGSAGKAGGSGGGGAYSGTSDSTRFPVGGAATSGQGNAGGKGDWFHYDIFGPDDWQGGGGGGGAGGAGGNAGSGNYGAGGGGGGAGLTWLDGVTRAGGGGGCANMPSNTGTAGYPGGGGSGGGGSGAYFHNQYPYRNYGSVGQPGAVNKGAGAGGDAGGSGVVIIRYAGTTQRASGGTVTTAGGYTYHTFNSSGTFTTY